MPLPISLDHINLWVLDAGDHWAIVDSGMGTQAGRDHWEALFANQLSEKPVGRVIITHYHGDHIGLAGWLCERWNVPMEISRTEWLMAKMLVLDVQPQTPPDVVAHYASHGWPAEDVAQLAEAPWGVVGQHIHRLPTGYKRLKAGQKLQIGDRTWTLVPGSGHSPEHCALFDEEARILIAGDQVLPRISSNVSVFPTEPDADPLGHWLDSITSLRQLPADTFVLPAHNEPFTSLHERLDQLDVAHRRKLDALLEFCATPITAYESFEVLFRRRIGQNELQIATGEALAHLQWLEKRQYIERLPSDGLTRFQRR